MLVDSGSNDSSSTDRAARITNNGFNKAQSLSCAFIFSAKNPSRTRIMSSVLLSLCSAVLLDLYDLAKKHAVRDNAVFSVIFFGTVAGALF